MTRRLNMSDIVQVDRRYGGSASVCERLRIQRLLQVVMIFAQLAESDAHGEEAQHRATSRGVDCGYRVQHLAMSDSPRSIRASPTSPRLKRGMTFGFRAEDFPRLMRALRIPRRVWLRSGSTFDGETALLLLRSMWKELPCSW